MIQLKNIALSIGALDIFKDVNSVFHKEDRVGIIGRNGAGKSTLLKVIAGIIRPTEGHISIEKDAKIAYLAQEDILASPLTVFEEAYSAFKDMFDAQNRIKEIETAVDQKKCTSEMLEQYAELQLKVQKFDQHVLTQQTYEILAGLGFTEAMTKKLVSELSTGWKMRLALAKLLLTDADFFLFDEPTNHLDIVTQQWFLNKLQSMKRGFLLVSHDRAYLEKACNAILEIERGRARFYRGNLQAYLTEKEAQQEIARATRSRQEREINQKQAIVERFRASATKARQAKSLEKQIDRIELIDVEPPLPVIKFYFPVPKKPGEIILTFNNICHGFNNSFLFNTISGEIQRGERVALIAANGVGKTTLINCFAGKYVPIKGTVTFGHNVQVAFFEQDQVQTLDASKTILEEVNDACPLQSELEIRKMLGAFLFNGDDVYKKIGVLSGGEKNRVAMTKILLQNANFLILDEPTNHLDLYAKDVLLQALQAYQGTILFVSHDVDFVSKLSSRIIELTPTVARSFLGTYEDFFATQQTKAAETVATAHYLNKQKLQNDRAQDNRALRKQIIDLERAINKLEQEEQKIHEKLAVASYGTQEYDKAVKRLLEIQKLLEQSQFEWEASMQKLV